MSGDESKMDINEVFRGGGRWSLDRFMGKEF